MAANKLPSAKHNPSPRALRPGEDYRVLPDLSRQVQELHSARRYRSALDLVLAELERCPDDEGALRLAALIIGGGQTDHLQAVEPLTPAQLGDSRVDPIFSQCSECKRQWVSMNWQMGFAHMTVMNPAGLQCQECGYVLCHECLDRLLQKIGLGTGSYGKTCPACGSESMGVPVYPTGRTPSQMIHRSSLRRIVVFREGPLAPDADYIQEILENVYPEAVTPGVQISAVPVGDWPSDMETFAIAWGIMDKIDMNQVDFIDGKDPDGVRLFFLRVFSEPINPPPPHPPLKKPINPPKPNPPLKKPTRWQAGLDRLSQSTRALSGQVNSRLRALASLDWGRPLRMLVGGQRGGPTLDQDMLSQVVDNAVTHHLERLQEALRGGPLEGTAGRKLRAWQNRLMIARVRNLGLEEMRKAYIDDCHHWASSISGDTLEIFSAVPTLNIQNARTYFESGYPAFLESETNRLGVDLGRTGVIHWTLMGNSTQFMVHLTYLYPGQFAIWAQDLLTSEEKRKYMRQ